MDERKLKSAFLKVKSDMSSLEDDIAKLQMQVAQTVRDGDDMSVKENDSSLDDIAKNLELELNSVKKLVSTLSTLVEQNTYDVKDIKSELTDLREDFDADGTSEAINKNNIGLVNTKLADFQELINGKIVLEVAELRVEFTEQIATVFDNMSKGFEKADKGSKSKKIESKKDNILEKDEKLLDSNQKTLIEEIEYEEMDEKPSKFKKAIKWLFVDDEDEIDTLKDDMTSKTSPKNKK